MSRLGGIEANRAEFICAVGTKPNSWKAQVRIAIIQRINDHSALSRTGAKASFVGAFALAARALD
ncbi:hypothetical protein [cf. Phormidesmis sp. LEGE 11477]|uniref:hypothetical protein n=1 Tax=cf. Phormidesmis sp. LEGE 11477 TaxID=1828680 RepID=UPI00187FC3CC|nr:hypothetical protein [cf. Phormidesmis sp. LEGE 11477]MBE9059473.1 hypothetical protein [cf. Phormidesmis sp. LEGE 11477]